MSGSISIYETVALSNNLRKIIVDIAKEAGEKAAQEIVNSLKAQGI